MLGECTFLNLGAKGRASHTHIELAHDGNTGVRMQILLCELARPHAVLHGNAVQLFNLKRRNQLLKMVPIALTKGIALKTSAIVSPTASVTLINTQLIHQFVFRRADTVT